MTLYSHQALQPDPLVLQANLFALPEACTVSSLSVVGTGRGFASFTFSLIATVGDGASSAVTVGSCTFAAPQNQPAGGCQVSNLNFALPAGSGVGFSLSDFPLGQNSFNYTQGLQAQFVCR